MNKSPLPPFVRRLGPDPHEGGQQTESLAGCPDVLELADGNFAVIGLDITEQANQQMFPTASCGPDERVILIPRKTLLRAKKDIPDAG